MDFLLKNFIKTAPSFVKDLINQEILIPAKTIKQKFPQAKEINVTEKGIKVTVNEKIIIPMEITFTLFLKDIDLKNSKIRILMKDLNLQAPKTYTRLEMLILIFATSFFHLILQTILKSKLPTPLKEDIKVYYEDEIIIEYDFSNVKELQILNKPLPIINKPISHILKVTQITHSKEGIKLKFEI